ncbi:glycine/betaine ABC transporter [Lactobacillus sp.] [Lactiplantibacillus mudanjiangensis]|uniref:Glycine/betaine ABC transporter [Lactobacillus sp.] n=1 Tax=Lactiplantibacillus mudanjiangensis TaxID=1296538 RepID=A0A660DZH1_9LACO|nr:glycine/betaine ABC transporter [Lactobacillus sp.] [Lactiplantibacillus mudanjiangensis]VDG28783.1 glycine/betaine ABC transporter [Lactobacillus sp.] [Lactiplantibacillus mudanjiangensis]
MYLPTIALFALASVVLLVGGKSLETGLTSILTWLTSNMSWLYMLVYVINFIFFIYLGLSKFGKTKLGGPNDKPEFSTFHWGSMVYATGIDASILMLSIVDPLRYLKSPSFGAKPFSNTAYNYAHMLGQFNWGPMAWMMFAPATIGIAYAMYVKHVKVQRLSAAISVLEGQSLAKRVARNLVDFLVVIGIMGGVGTSVGMEIPVISKVLSTVTGIPDTMTLKLGLFAILFVIFALAVFNGLKRGIGRLSSAHIWLAIGFLVVVLLVGPTVYILNSETNSIGLFINKFVSMSFNTAANGPMTAMQSQTIFYWGWWLSFMPVMGLFIARISRGRTIRQVLGGMLLWGSLGCVSFYAVLGGYALYLQKMGIVNLVHILNTQGQAAVIAAVLTTLPLKMIMLVLYCLSCFIFLATTVSSFAFITSSFTSKELAVGEQPSRFNRMSWVVIFLLFSLGLVTVGGFKAIQSICAMSGFPLIAVCLVLLYSIYHDLSTDPVKEAAKAQAKATAKARRQQLARDVEISTKTDYARERRAVGKSASETD